MAAPDPRARGAALGLAAAALFGASAPVAKLLLPGVSPIVLAALLYLGAGLALTAVRLAACATGVRAREARLSASDAPILAGIVAAGGVLGPILLLVGLGRVSGVAGALLLNLEAPLTMLVALALFREHLGARELAAALLVVAAAAVLGYRPGELAASWPGVLAIAGACLCWAIDNNLTQRLSHKDPIAFTQVKTLLAAACSFAIALAWARVRGEHAAAPSRGVALSALVLGAIAYGASIALSTHALRLLGAARHAAYFATAPFAGAAIALPLLGERLAPADLAALGLMIGGVVLMVRERHGHAHTHEAIVHDHLHVHDAHHLHTHAQPFTEPHAHPHRHEAITHDHPHVSDAHHRHAHGAAKGSG